MGPVELARFGNTSNDFQVFCANEEFWTGTRRDFFCAPDFIKASLLGQAHLDFPKRQTFLRNVMPLLLEGIVSVDEITQLHIACAHLMFLEGVAYEEVRMRLVSMNQLNGFYRGSSPLYCAVFQDKRGGYEDWKKGLVSLERLRKLWLKQPVSYWFTYP
jgi:hypothetical protein